MKKQGAKRRQKVSGYMLMPEQVAKYVTPLHMALELLPLGLFNKDHANKLAQVINLIAVDSANRDTQTHAAANACAEILAVMFNRVQKGKTWNVTTEERARLREYILIFDRAMRTWTSGRLLINAASVDAHNAIAKRKGGSLLDRVPLTDAEMREVEDLVRARVPSLTAHLAKPSTAHHRMFEPGRKRG